MCLLCKMSGRDCSFASQPIPEHLLAGSSSSYGGRSVSPIVSSSTGQGDVSSSYNITPPTSSAASPASSSSPSTAPAPDDALNLHHMELFSHLVSDKDIYNLGDKIGDLAFRLSFALGAALENPYLMHQFLAFSARHLAHLRPDRSEFYLHQAFNLRARAVSLFNAAWGETALDENNCVAVLLFSASLGHHLLADTLARRDAGSGLDDFLEHWVQCVEINRGIHTVCREAWPMLMESKLQAILSFSAGFTSREPRGDECQGAFVVINSSKSLREDEKVVCRQAARYLQVGFDALLAPEDEKDVNRYSMIFSWTMLVPPEFTGLLAAKQPEALIILAYYAALLYYGRSMWQVGDAGTYVLGLVGDHLGSEWEYELLSPQAMVAGSMTRFSQLWQNLEKV